MIPKCTIIIPTYNRPNYLKRILSYYTKYGRNFKIIVADSSSDENKKINKKNISLFSNLEILYLNKYTSKIELNHKISDALNYVNTKYSVLCADDDFITPNGINQSVAFLEKNSDFSVAQGRYIGFSTKNNDEKRTKKFYFIRPLYTNESIIFSDPKDRMYEHLSNYNLPTIYAVHRMDLLKMIFKDTVEFTDDDRFGELLPSMLDLIYGKMKNIDVIYSAREGIVGSTGQTSKNLKDFRKEGTYEKKYNKFRECLVEHLIKNSQLNSDEAKELIDEAMSKYLKGAYSRSFKRILIGKMNNLLKALGLPESVGRDIRMLYRKIFNPKCDLNNLKKLREINDLKNTIESKDSKYFDDFERIRKHVLLHAKK